MGMLARKPAPRRPTNISLDADLVQEAKAEGVNLSKACETGLEAELRRVKNERWLKENREALLAWNEWIEENGLPFEDHRQF